MNMKKLNYLLKSIIMKSKKLIILLLLAMSLTLTVNAQVGVGTASPNSSSMLDVTSTTKDLLTPRMTATQRTAISSPATGLIVYQTDGIAGFYYYTGAAWVVLINGTDALPAVNGSAVTNLNASNLASGTVPTARLGSGTASSATYLRGDGTWSTPATGGGTPTFLTKSADYTISSSDAANDLYISCSATNANPATFTLPLANSVSAGRTIYILGTGTSYPNINVKTSGSDKIFTYASSSSGITNLLDGTGYTCNWIALTSDGSSKWFGHGYY